MESLKWIEPYIGTSIFDPKFRQGDNENTEIFGGVNLAFSKRWRVQMETAHVISAGSDAFEIQTTAFRIQLGARFKE